MPTTFRTCTHSLLVFSALLAAASGAFAFGETRSATFIPGYACFTAPTVLSNKSMLLTVRGLQTNVTGIARIREDGSLDPAFGQNGITVLPIDLGTGEAHVQLGHGKALVIGAQVVRLNVNGSLDSSYGPLGSGKTVYAFSNDSGPADMQAHAVQADGAIVLMARERGPRQLQEVVFTRFDSNGVRDTSFGEAGFLLVPSGLGDSIYAWSVQANGAVDVASYSSTTGPVHPAVKRYSPYLWVMSEFQPGTRLIPEQGLASWTSSTVKVDPFGGVLIASPIFGSVSPEMMLSRFGPDGLPDPAFGVAGRIVTATGPGMIGSTFATGRPLLLWALPGGGWSVLALRYLQVGSGFFSRSEFSTVVLHFNSAGGLDTSFQRATIDYAASRASFTHLDDGRLVAVSTGAGCNVTSISTDAVRAEGTVIEYYHPALDHYFMTLEGLEAGILDDNVATMGWVRTGRKFGAWAAVELPGASRLCRFYGDLSAGPNSHFYIPQGAGCDGLRTLEANTPLGTLAWRLEGLTFGIREAFGGQCAANLTPVYRFYNRGYERGIASNHRYVVDAAARAEMAAKGWAEEGIAFCTPPAALRTNPTS